MSTPKVNAFQAAKRWSDANHWWGEGTAADGVKASIVSRVIIDPAGAVAAYGAANQGFTVNGLLSALGPVALASYAVTALPAATAGRLIYVPDDIDGPTIAFGNGSDWINVRDSLPVSP